MVAVPDGMAPVTLEKFTHRAGTPKSTATHQCHQLLRAGRRFETMPVAASHSAPAVSEEQQMRGQQPQSRRAHQPVRPPLERHDRIDVDPTPLRKFEHGRDVASSALSDPVIPDGGG